MQGNGLARGLDFLTTVRAQQWIEAPPDLLGPEMEGFAEMVTFVGAPLPAPHGNADTVMERIDDVQFGEEVPTRLVAFANVSAAPIRLRGTGPIAGYFDLYVTLSPTAESPGRSVYYSDDGRSGTFESELSLSPLFELRPLGGGESTFVDTGVTPIPGFPMRLGSTGGSWSLDPPFENAVRHFAGRSLFYTSEVFISATAQKDAEGQAGILAACDKAQAEFVAPGRLSRFERVGFPGPKTDANIEID